MTSSNQAPQSQPVNTTSPVYVNVTNRGCLSSLVGASIGTILGIIVLIVFALGGCLLVGLLFGR